MIRFVFLMSTGGLHFVSVCCIVLQCVATRCSVSHLADDPIRWSDVNWCVVACQRVLRCVAVCRNVLQCVAMCCSVLQRVSSGRSQSFRFVGQKSTSALQRVAVCCRVLQRH